MWETWFLLNFSMNQNLLWKVFKKEKSEATAKYI